MRFTSAPRTTSRNKQDGGTLPASTQLSGLFGPPLRSKTEEGFSWSSIVTSIGRPRQCGATDLVPAPFFFEMLQMRNDIRTPPTTTTTTILILSLLVIHAWMKHHLLLPRAKRKEEKIAKTTSDTARPSDATSSEEFSNDFELVIRATKHLDTVLVDNHGAPSDRGVGLHEKITHVAETTDLSNQVIGRMRYLVTVRNRLVHEVEMNELTERRYFVHTYNAVLDALRNCNRLRRRQVKKPTSMTLLESFKTGRRYRLLP